jgi:hypothetical protein
MIMDFHELYGMGMIEIDYCGFAYDGTMITIGLRLKIDEQYGEDHVVLWRRHLCVSIDLIGRVRTLYYQETQHHTSMYSLAVAPDTVLGRELMAGKFKPVVSSYVAEQYHARKRGLSQ